MKNAPLSHQSSAVLPTHWTGQPWRFSGFRDQVLGSFFRCNTVAPVARLVTPPRAVRPLIFDCEQPVNVFAPVPVYQRPDRGTRPVTDRIATQDAA
jgi:hypothetical protein